MLSCGGLASFPSAALAVTLAGCDESAVEPLPDDVGTILMSNNGAVVVRGDTACSVIDGYGKWFPGDGPLPCGTENATYSKNGNAKVTVQASGVPTDAKHTVHWGPYNPGIDWANSYLEPGGPLRLTHDPYPCWVVGTEGEALFTVNWHAHVTPNGNTTLVCHYQKKWEFRCDDYDNCPVPVEE